MKQILVEIDDSTALRLEEAAPSRQRKRSSFIRVAILRALDALAEQRMRAAYLKTPQAAGDDYVDPEAWEPATPASRPKRRSR